jgi:hypothetical protein
MSKPFYLKVEANGIISDCITYPYEDYIEHQGDVPMAVLGGWHKYENGSIIEIPELNPTTIENQIAAAVDAAVLDMLERGVI